MNLKNKRVVLTGATGGLGQELALALAKKGAEVTLVGRNVAKLIELKNTLMTLGSSVHTITSDLGEHALISSKARQLMGGVDILINNAGIMDFTRFENQDEVRIAEMIQTNVTAPIQLTQALMGDFIEQNSGHIVFVGSIFGSLGFPYFTTYCASKFAIHGFSQSLRRELLGSGIGISYIAPRGIKTAMNDANTVAMWKKTGSQMDEPQVVANRIIKALEKEELEVFIGQPQTFFAWLNSLCPRLISLGLKKDTAIARQYL